MDEAFASQIEKALANAPLDATGVLLVNLGAVRRNYRKLRELASPAEVAAVLKADAYGAGVIPAFQVLEEEGCRTFFVATLAEAQQIPIRSRHDGTVYVLDGLFPGSAPMFEDARVRPVLGSMAEIAEWATYCAGRNARLPAAIHIDTGMTRLGLSAADLERLAAAPGALAPFGLKLVMSHLACADEPAHPKNAGQLGRFARLSALFPGVPRSLANSAGIFLGSPYRFDIVRPGIALYGGRAIASAPNPMEHVVSLYGRIAQVQLAEPGETVGYGAAQTLKRRTRIATVTAGYADGFFRAASANDEREGPPGLIAGHRLPLLGRVSMDLITFDATDVPDELVPRGGWVELLGERVTVDDFAGFAETIGYEVLTSLGRRYHRVYLDD